MSYLLMFTIGPVQSLIVNSRKVRDMYAGSQILSKLMSEVVSSSQKNPIVKILLPSTESTGQKGQPAGNVETGSSEVENAQKKMSSMPNRLIAQLKVDSEEKSKEIAKQMECQVKKSFEKLYKKCFQEAQIEGKGLDLAKQQLEDFLEIYWVVEPYDTEEYKVVYGKLFKKMQMIKGIRTFSQISEPWNRKCALFPQYNGIFAKEDKSRSGGSYPSNINRDNVYDISQKEKLKYGVKQNEALSAIALVKRIYGKDLSVYSLRQMLLRHRIDQGIDQRIAKKTERMAELEEIRQELGDGSGAGLGDMISNAVYDCDNKHECDREEYSEKIWRKAKKMHEILKSEHISLSNYYAMVKFDGDSIGDKFLGMSTPGEQRKLSDRIGEFAKGVPSVVKKYNGIHVYAGGEDFLGFLPLDNLFDCLEELHQSFRGIVGMWFSAGVVVAHLMQPLKEVAKEAERMERLAKQADGKRSVAIGILKRSGENVIMPPYKLEGESDHEYPAMKDISQLIRDISESKCSKSLLYNINDLFRCFMVEGTIPDQTWAEVLLRRAAMGAQVEKVDDIVQKLMLFYRQAGGLEVFLNTLNGVTFLAREVEV